MSVPRRRAYRSAVRNTAAAATRERILEAAEGILAVDGVAGLAFGRLAAAADVSVPTVYRHFRSTEELLGAFFMWFRPRVGMSHDTLFGAGAEDLAALPALNFPRFEAHGAVLRALIDSPEANRVRERAIENRAQRAAKAFQRFAPKCEPADLGTLLGPIIALQSPQTWRWLRDTWELDPEATQRAASWAMTTLIAALQAGPAPARSTNKAPATPAPKRAASRSASKRRTKR